MFLSIIIASRGRPDVLFGTLKSIFRQDRLPDEIIVVVADKSDLPVKLPRNRLKVISNQGLGASVQRNIGLKAIDPESDVVIFLDDDVELAHDYVHKVSRVMELFPQIVAFSCTPVLNYPEDGLMSRESAIEFLSNLDEKPSKIKIERGLYGCNMIVRSTAAVIEGFDEQLVDYAWLEDRDFGIRLEKYGDVVDYTGASIIHFGAPSGRLAEVKIGYSQIANPAYLFFKKRTLSLKEYITHGVTILPSNFLGLLGIMKLITGRDPKVDRLQRLRGNLIALKDIFLGNLDPKRVRGVK